MKNFFFGILVFVGFYGANAQTYWETHGNVPESCPPGQLCPTGEYDLGTIGQCFDSGGTCYYNFNIIRGGETMVRFENNLVIIGPDADHQVLIGDPGTISTPIGYRLYVAEGILTERVKVALEGTSDWSDYVFYENYKLMSLEEVESFINKYGHLPNIPSAEKLVKEGGIDLGKMQASQMAKIEELTLHLIQKDKEIKALQKQLASLSKEVELLVNKQ